MNQPLLYILAESKTLPENQYLDPETIDWIEKNGTAYKSATPFKEILLDHVAESYALLKDYIPFEPSVFSRGTSAPNSIHGELHAYRVALLSGVLALEYTNDDLKPYMLAGLYHDIARVNDKTDEEHGMRSFERAVHLNLLHKTGNDRIKEAIARHEDESVTAHDRPLVYILQVADGLDRFRLPKLRWWPNMDRMPIAPSNDLLSLAYTLVLSSERLALDAESNAAALDMAMSDILQGRV